MAIAYTRAQPPSMFNIDDAAAVETMDNYERLACAVILQAVKDYRRASRSGRIGVVKECERFFLGKWFEVLTDLPGSVVLNKLRQEDGQKKTKKQAGKGKRGRPKNEEKYKIS